MSDLERLAEELRFAPKPALLRQIDRVLDLVPSIDPDSTYGLNWLVKRITGYAPDAEDDSLLVGAALLGDLSALLEHLCSHAGFGPHDVAIETIGVAELESRWDVSRRTLERYRRRGLIALRVQEGGSRVSLRFPLNLVEVFESRESTLVRAASSFRRLSEDERRHIHELASGRTGSCAAIAQQIATETGRSVGAVLSALEASPGALAPHSGVLSAPAKRRMFKAWRDGAPAPDLARDTGVSVDTARRTINLQRAAMLRRVPLVPEAGSTDLGAILEHPLVTESLDAHHEPSARAWVDSARASAPPDPDVERLWADARATLLARVRVIVEALDPYAPSALALDDAETGLRWATRLRIQLLDQQRGLVLRAIEERLGGPLMARAASEIARAHLRAHLAASRALDRHDPSKGGRVAAPIALAISRSLAGDHAPAPAGRAALADAPLDDWTRRLDRWQSWLDAPPDVAGLGDERARAVLVLRFGLAGAKPLTLAEMSSAHSVSAQEVRRCVRAASLATGRRASE